MPHPFRFGVSSAGGALAEWQDFARTAESLGYTTLTVSDHFGPQLAPFPALMSAAAVTSTIRLATIVLDNDFRHPAVMAKEAATVDALTGGRLELGLGAGWLQADYDKTGIPFEAPGVRFERLTETVRICKAFFTEPESVTFQGKHYQLTNLDAAPKPIQPGGPPITIGGRKKRVLTFAGQHADIVGISMLDRPAPGDPQPATFQQKIAWVRDGAGDRFPDLVLHMNLNNIEVTDNQQTAIEEVAARVGLPASEVLGQPTTVIGTVDQICEQLQGWREQYGFSYFGVPGRLIDVMAPIVSRLAGT